MKWEYQEIKPTVLVQRVYSVFEDTFDPGHCFAGEAHDFWECVYVVEGELSVSADGQVYRLAPGDIVFHKPWEFHCFTVESPLGARLRIFSFEARGPAMVSMAQRVCRLTRWEQEMLDGMYAYAGRLRPLDTFMDWHTLLHQGPPVYAEMMSLYVSQLIITLAQREECLKVVDAPAARFFRQAVEYMQEHVGSPLTVSEIARSLHCSEATLRRLFQKYATISVHRYFLLLKIHCATDLLRQGYSVEQTAAQLGFSSQSYFSACYKRETGQPPSSVAE